MRRKNQYLKTSLKHPYPQHKNVRYLEVCCLIFLSDVPKYPVCHYMHLVIPYWNECEALGVSEQQELNQHGTQIQFFEFPSDTQRLEITQFSKTIGSNPNHTHRY